MTGSRSTEKPTGTAGVGKSTVVDVPPSPVMMTLVIEAGASGLPKVATKGVHRGVSNRHLQGYFNEYTFRHSHRNDEEEMFFTMFRQIVPVERLAA